MASGVPILMLPPPAATELGGTILVGWNGSREGTRAVHEALPFLVRAQRVVVCAVGEVAIHSLDAAAGMLRRHGVRAEPEAMDGPEAAAPEVLLRSALAHGGRSAGDRQLWPLAPARVALGRSHASYAAQGSASCPVRQLMVANARTPIAMDQSPEAAGLLGIDPAAIIQADEPNIIAPHPAHASVLADLLEDGTRTPLQKLPRNPGSVCGAGSRGSPAEVCRRTRVPIDRGLVEEQGSGRQRRPSGECRDRSQARHGQ